MFADGQDRTALRNWLAGVAIVVALTIAVGGGTRLTESGLSITEWKPVTGVLPPFSAGAWEAEYQRYLLIPEAQTVHRGITLAEFQGLYWWEWAHRLVARLAGLVIAVPFFLFWGRGRIPRQLRFRLAWLPVLVLAQGALGWYMVRSGLAIRTSVSPYRLVAHLSLALVILAIAVWTLGDLRRLSRDSGTAGGLSHRRALPALAGLVLLTMLSGGFVAGLDAGRIFNEFPLMGGRVVPVGYAALGGWRNPFENPIAAQFHHRLFAIGTLLLVWSAWIAAERRRWGISTRRWMRAAAIIALVQLGLGIAALLLAVPVALGVAHQMGAVLLLSTVLVAANSER
jgi:cytochrome c oxidase assembly protein subunit 15